MSNENIQAPNEYKGNQVLINSDRLIFNAKTDSILLFSNEVIGFSTNGSFHFDTSDNETSKFVISSPNIYLGLADKKLPTEPAVLGDKLEDLLYSILLLIQKLTGDIEFKVSYVIPSPGGLTGLNPLNTSALQGTRDLIDRIKNQIKEMKSETTKIA